MQTGLWLAGAPCRHLAHLPPTCHIHPPLCRYDAYGMTIVEAASQGAPSLVQGGGHVGATDLLSEAAGEVLCTDMDVPVSQVRWMGGSRWQLRQTAWEVLCADTDTRASQVRSIGGGGRWEA